MRQLQSLHYVAMVLSFLFFTNACHFGPKNKMIALPSGRQVKVLGFAKLYSTQHQDWALVLKYQTNLSLDKDGNQILEEVNFLWQLFQSEVDKGNYKYAVISAHTSPKGFIVTWDRANNYAFKKDGNGSWQRFFDN